MDEATLGALRIVPAALLDLAFAIAVGAFASTRLLQRHAGVGTAAAWRLMSLACLIAAAALSGLLWIDAMILTELPPGAAAGAAPGIVAGTHAGRAWAAAAASVLLGAAAGWRGTVAARRQDGGCGWATVVAGIALVAFAVARAAASHAGTRAPGIGIPTMAVHLLATSLWSGLVLVSVMRVAPAAQEFARWARGLSTLATVALAAVVATGLLLAWQATGGAPQRLADSRWGGVLGMKLGAVLGAGLLGACNRVANLPHLADDRHRRSFVRILALESVFLVAALLAAAVLAQTDPPQGGGDYDAGSDAGSGAGAALPAAATARLSSSTV